MAPSLTQRLCVRAATALMFTEKIGMLPERIFEALLNDRLVAKGTVLTVVTHIFREYLKHSTIDELVALLTRGKIVHRLLDYFPPGKQTEECFEEHFGAAGMQNVVRPLRLRAATNTSCARWLGSQVQCGLYTYHPSVKGLAPCGWSRLHACVQDVNSHPRKWSFWAVCGLQL